MPRVRRARVRLEQNGVEATFPSDHHCRQGDGEDLQSQNPQASLWDVCHCVRDGPRKSQDLQGLVKQCL